MIIDAHTHIYPDKIAIKASHGISDFYNIRVLYDGTVGKLLEIGNSAGIDKYVVHSVATAPEQVASINGFIASAVAANPDRFIGFATLHPDSKCIAEDVDRAIDMGLSGIKLHPDFQKFNADSSNAMKIYEAIQGMLPLLIHTGDYRTEYSKPYRILNILKAFPTLDVIAAHLGGWSEWGTCAQELAQAGIYVDTSSSQGFMEPSRVRELIDIFGIDKVFFGSDYPMWDAVEELDMLSKILLTQEEKEKVLHLNFERLMGKYNK
ncbi:MAG: amidohydrolase family protein [Eubacteriales bacterium]